MMQALRDEAGARTRLGNIGRTKLYELTASGELPSVKIGRRRLWTDEGIDQFIARLADQGAADRMHDAELGAS